MIEDLRIERESVCGRTLQSFIDKSKEKFCRSAAIVKWRGHRLRFCQSSDIVPVPVPDDMSS